MISKHVYYFILFLEVKKFAITQSNFAPYKKLNFNIVAQYLLNEKKNIQITILRPKLLKTKDKVMQRGRNKNLVSDGILQTYIV